MSLADYTPERVTISLRNKPLMEVRGLSLEDVSVLIRQHLPDLEKLYDLAQAGGQVAPVLRRFSEDGFLLKTVTEVPNLAARVISLAADEPGSDHLAKLLPIATQIMALQAIVRLTFEDIGGPKGFLVLLENVTGRPLPAMLAQASART
jgi:hypothetical protein